MFQGCTGLNPIVSNSKLLSDKNCSSKNKLFSDHYTVDCVLLVFVFSLKNVYFPDK